jgi:uncharacterized protein
MAYDDRSVKGMSSSLMRARIGTKLLSGLYDSVPTLMTSAIRLMVDLPGASSAAGPPYAFNISISPAWCSGIKGARLVARGKIDIGWINPSIIASMAYHGRGPFRSPMPLRVLAVFPSWDRLVVAVSARHGIRSMAELIEKRPALRVSVADNDCVNFAIKAALRAHGLSFQSFEDWGGAVEPVVRPSNPRRIEGIASGEVDAVIDEGLTSWAPTAVQHEMNFLHFSPKAMTWLDRYGFGRAPLDGPIFEGKLKDPVEAVDFSGWPIVTRADLPEELAYHIVGVIEQMREDIPYDTPGIPPMKHFCSDTPDGPLDIPLHPGAERYYREKGHL